MFVAYIFSLCYCFYLIGDRIRELNGEVILAFI